MGKWIREFNRIKCQTFLCSECGSKVYYIDGSCRGKNPKPNICQYHYCPTCRAEMEIEKIEKEN